MFQKGNVFYGKMESRCGEKLRTGNWRVQDQVTRTLGPIQKVMKSSQKILRKGKQQIPMEGSSRTSALTACPESGGREARAMPCEQEQTRRKEFATSRAQALKIGAAAGTFEPHASL